MSVSDYLDKLSDPLSVFEADPSAQDASAMPKICVDWLTRVDWLEISEAHIFKADMPGLKKNEIKVQILDLDGHTLQISGERKKENAEERGKWHRMERAQGSFRRNFRLPGYIKLDEVEARLDGGVLTVTVPKDQNQKMPEPQERSIEIADDRSIDGTNRLSNQECTDVEGLIPVVIA